MVEKPQVGKTPADEGVVKTPDQADLRGVGGKTPQEQLKEIESELEVVLKILRKTEEVIDGMLKALEKGEITLSTKDYRKAYELMTYIATLTACVLNRFDRIIEIVRYGLR